MRYDYIDPVVSTTLRVLGTAIPGTARRGEVTMLRGDQVRGEVSVVIGMTGDAEGDVVISMNTETALNVCSFLLGSKTDALDPNALDALGELGNMIAGNAVSALNDLGFDFSMKVPGVSADGGKRAGAPDQEALQIPLASPCGEMNMNLILGSE
jgi:chemotaxis protein CheX